VAIGSPARELMLPRSELIDSLQESVDGRTGGSGGQVTGRPCDRADSIRNQWCVQFISVLFHEESPGKVLQSIYGDDALSLWKPPSQSTNKTDETVRYNVTLGCVNAAVTWFLISLKIVRNPKVTGSSRTSHILRPSVFTSVIPLVSAAATAAPVKIHRSFWSLISNFRIRPAYLHLGE
jgi:hypothetical protein